MKQRNFMFTALCALMLSFGWTACDDLETREPDPTIDPVVDIPAYLLNEGSWGGNNAGIAYFSPSAVEETFVADIYRQSNGVAMGDLANTMLLDRESLYVLVGGSRYVARLSLTGREVVRYSFPATEGEPRCMCLDGGYLYITQYGGQVTKLNAETLRLAATFTGGDNLDGIAAKDGRLYVSNSYRIEGSGSYTYLTEVFVVNATNMSLERTLTVTENPADIWLIDDELYLLSVGNYYDVKPALQHIDSETGEVTFIAHATKVTKGNDGLLFCLYSETVYDDNWNSTNTNHFFTYRPTTGEVDTQSFLKNLPEGLSSAVIYLLEVDETSGDIYLSTTDYTTTGDIYRFNSDGKLLDTFDCGGINPSVLLFAGE